jgi:hypothetical protein
MDFTVLDMFAKQLTDRHVSNAMSPITLTYLWIGLLVAFAPFSFAFYFRLKKHHPDTWRELYITKSTGQRNDGHDLMLTWFVLRRKYRNLEDPLLTRVGDASLIFTVLFLALLLLSLYFGAACLGDCSGPSYF